MKSLRLNNKTIRWILGFVGAVALFDTLAILSESARSQVSASYSFLSFLFCIFSAVVYEKVLQLVQKENILSIAHAVSLESVE